MPKLCHRIKKTAKIVQKLSALLPCSVNSSAKCWLIPSEPKLQIVLDAAFPRQEQLFKHFVQFLSSKTSNLSKNLPQLCNAKPKPTNIDRTKQPAQAYLAFLSPIGTFQLTLNETSTIRRNNSNSGTQPPMSTKTTISWVKFTIQHFFISDCHLTKRTSTQLN